MSEMVERVARAMANKITGWEADWPTFQHAARAAIEAMREPTDWMTDAVPASYSAAFRAIWPKICADIYRTMIDEALKVQP